MEFGLKGTSRLVADVTGSRHSGLGFTVFWLFTADTGQAYNSDGVNRATAWPLTNRLAITTPSRFCSLRD